MTVINISWQPAQSGVFYAPMRMPGQKADTDSRKNPEIMSAGRAAAYAGNTDKVEPRHP
jgi:hypothetical protein